MPKAYNLPKSPFILITIIGILVMATLVVASAYFLRPSIETELKKKLGESFSKAGIVCCLITISGRDVILNGAVPNKATSHKAEKTAKETWGVRQVTNKLLIKN